MSDAKAEKFFVVYAETDGSGFVQDASKCASRQLQKWRVTDVGIEIYGDDFETTHEFYEKSERSMWVQETRSIDSKTAVQESLRLRRMSLKKMSSNQKDADREEPWCLDTRDVFWCMMMHLESLTAVDDWIRKSDVECAFRLWNRKNPKILRKPKWCDDKWIEQSK